MLQKTRLPPSLMRAALLLALSSSSVSAFATVVVTSCADDGSAGTLRDAVSRAVDGDTVDMSALTCSTITLGDEILVNQKSLWLHGPPAQTLTLTTQYHSGKRLIEHAQTGQLTLENLRVRDVKYRADNGNYAVGGCIFSAGNVSLIRTSMNNCQALAAGSGGASGGAVYAFGAVTLLYSTISGSSASSVIYSAHGGAVTAAAGLSMSSSTLSGNSALAQASTGMPPQFLHGAAGGGAYVGGVVDIAYSTISGNTSSGVAGGLDALFFVGGRGSLRLKDSTVSSNYAKAGGGVYSIVPTTVIHGTIANNTAATSSDGKHSFAAGLTVIGALNEINVSLTGLLASGNTIGNPDNEIDFDTTNVSLSANRNLIRASAVALPANNVGGCPLLGPLRNNGGPTLTHALLSHSPAIDAATGLESGVSDQRDLPYTRFSGPGLVADIGAYEVQQDDIVFNVGFETCPALR